MEKLVRFLSSPAWQGVAGVFTIAGTAIAAYTLYLTVYPPSQAPPVALVPLPVPDNPVPDDPQGHVNEIIRNTLGSVNDTYRGMHQYYNDAPSMGVLAGILLVLGILILIGHWQSKRDRTS